MKRPFAPKRSWRRRCRRRLHDNENNRPRFIGVESLEPRLLLSADSVLEVAPLPDLTLDTEPAGVESAVISSALQPLSETFELNSNPGANHTIHLDFDGHTTSGTTWNSAFTGGASFTTPAYDFDGNTSSFSDAELERIQYIWQRVAEDFISFDVNVTTEDPGAAALTKSGGGDAQWGVRVVIGGSSYDWYGAGAGGLAYVGSFNWSSDTPVFVFEEQLGNGNEKYTAEASSHEAGHALGLGHDGATGTSYYSGHGSGETGWAPIMGVGYYENLSQWSKGEYAGANNTQDDLAIITGNNGFGYRADDHGGTAGSATALELSGSSVSGSGIIERNTDYDMFSFTTGAGSISINVDAFARGPNLDIGADLLNSSGQVVLSSNPADLLGATLSGTVAAGDYYVRITGVGKGDPLSTGYTDYGSLGQYTLTGQIVSPGAALSISDVTVDEAVGIATFNVTLSEASAQTVTVDVATANGTAVEGSDYFSINQTLVFDPGETIKTVNVSIVDDSDSEANETFLVNLSNVTGGASIIDGQGVGTIVDNDIPIPTISITDDGGSEGNAFKGKKAGDPKITTFTFTVSLSSASSQTVTVNYSTADDTATAGDDYYAAGGTLVFAPGVTSQTISIDVLGDDTAEPDETFNVVLSGATNADIGDGTGVGTILNDDGTTDDGGGGGGGGGGGNGRGNGKGKPAPPAPSDHALAALFNLTADDGDHLNDQAFASLLDAFAAYADAGDTDLL